MPEQRSPWFLLLPLLALIPSTVLAQADFGPPVQFDTRTLEGVSARGRLLAAYDLAAWHGTDAVQALHPQASDLRGYFARPLPDARWEVLFGRPSATLDTFYLTYRALQAAPGDTAFTATALTPTLPDTGYFAAAGRALALAQRTFGTPGRPYNVAILPDDAPQSWLVYLMPAPTQWGYWPLGADVRYRISPDGRTLMETRQLHRAIIEYGPPKEGHSLAAATHTHVLSDVPEDTDVFLVLQRMPRIPEYIATQNRIFAIDTAGAIQAFARTQ